MPGRELWLIAPSDVPDLPADTAGLCCDFRDGLSEALGGGLLSLYLSGGMAFPRPTRWWVDVDFHALLAHPLTDRDRDAVGDLHRELAERWPLGDELDGYYVLASDAGKPEWPTSQDWGAIDWTWALHRAHVLAGRFMLMLGNDPRAILTEPTWAELGACLSTTMSYIVEHHEPAFAPYSVLNACRVLYSVRTRDVVISKYRAAQWGIAELPDWSGLLEAAVRSYTLSDTTSDRQLLAEQRAAFVSSVMTETGLPPREPTADARRRSRVEPSAG